MDRVPVQSSNVRSIGYERTSERLEVEFVHGGVYEYFAVPPEKHAALLAAPSIGGYLAQHIKPLHTVRKLDAGGAP